MTTTTAPRRVKRPARERTARDPSATKRVARAARKRARTQDQGDFDTTGRGDPIAILEGQATSRVPELVPIRYGRMLVSPFTFYRGAAAVMAADLGGAPSSGLNVQLCGDAHLSNFGLFASPERRLMFDVNDFDETHPGPFEWDVKRLAASLVVAGRANGFTPKQQRQVAQAAAASYQAAMNLFAGMDEMDVWYAKADVEDLRATIKKELPKRWRTRLDRQTAKARTRDSEAIYGRLTATADGQTRILADPPLIVPIGELFPDRRGHDLTEQLRTLLADYRVTLHSNHQHLLDRFEVVDMARKVVGVGSVGTRCWIILLRGLDRGDPLFLQAKEAPASVLAPFVPSAGGLPTYHDQGERVVRGQRLMQAATDIFLGWKPPDPADGAPRCFYIRQLRDWKLSVIIENLAPTEMRVYADLCAWTLARAHARTGPRAAVAGYVGDGDAFPQAISRFACSYADQNELDHAALVQAVRSGRITAVTGT